MAADGDSVLLHGLEQSALRLRSRPIDLVGKHDLSEDRSAVQLEAPARPALTVQNQDVRAGYVARHQIRCELNPREAELQALGEGTDHQCLAEARVALQKNVPSRHERPEHLIDDARLPDDALCHRRSQARDTLGRSRESLGELLIRHEPRGSLHRGVGLGEPR